MQSLSDLDEKITLKKFDAAKRGKAYDELGNAEDDIKKLKQERRSKAVKTSGRYPLNTPTPTYEAYDSSNQQPETSSESAKKKNIIDRNSCWY